MIEEPDAFPGTSILTAGKFLGILFDEGDLS